MFVDVFSKINTIQSSDSSISKELNEIVKSLNAISVIFNDAFDVKR